VDVFKKPFEVFKRRHLEKYYKPEMRYHVIKIHRKRLLHFFSDSFRPLYTGDDLVWESDYPHRYQMKPDHKNEIIISAIRHSEHGNFYLYAGQVNQ
jgi:hypothetical protein